MLSFSSSQYKYLLIFITITAIFYVFRSLQERPIQIRRFITDRSCYWPPENISEIQNREGYNFTLCIKLNEEARANSAPKRYLTRELFYVSLPKRTVTFEEMVKLPRKVFKTVKYPSIFRTYPQDVPMVEIVQNITQGRAISYVRFYLKFISFLLISNYIF